MRIFTRVLPLALAATLFILASACSSGGGGDTVSADPLEVLTSSADSFQEEVQSVESDLQFSINAGGLDLGTTSQMTYQAPDQMHMTMTVTGVGEFEILQLGSEMYLNVPSIGWISFSVDDVGLEEVGLDVVALQKTFSDHSVVDYAALIQGIGGEVEDLGDETLDGATYRHYQGTVDFAALAAAFSDASGASSDLGLDDVSGALTFDIWVDPDSYLPYKLTASGEFPFGIDSMVFDATMSFTSYNEPVEFPGAPADAIPLAGLLTGLD
jgi:hypothetical protein